MIRKIAAIFVGFIAGFLIYAFIYQVVVELAGGYDSEGFHNLMSAAPIIKPGLWIFSFFIGSMLAGYIAGNRGNEFFYRGPLV